MTKDKLPLTSQDVLAERLVALRALFPEVFTEGKVDFDRLKQTLGESVDEGRERYGLSWAGKSEAIRNLQAQSVGTLTPIPEESVNFDTTENIFIEGDNLEVLKLLQKSYYNQIKMIYIDPPYNTGKEFIYPDNFREGLEDYLRYSGQKNGEGIKLTTNTETNGRFHSKWLNMMYPRLFIARSLLRNDGVIFISIDDHEVCDLRLLLNEIFGEENFLGTIVWKNATDNNPSNVAVEHEYIYAYCKSRNDIEPVWKTNFSDIKDVLVDIGNQLISRYSNPEMLQSAYSEWFKANKGYLGVLDRYKYIDKGGVYTGSQSVHNPGKEGYRYDVLHPTTNKPCQQPLMGYRFPEERMKKLVEQGKIIFGEDESKIIELKVYALEYQEKMSSILELDGRLGSYDIKQVFPELTKVFNSPKPIRLLSLLISFVVREGDIVLDFFAGSCTTAHAILDINQEEKSKRKFIMVQLPECCDQASEAFKSGYKTIADIGKERIRRAINKINEEENGKLDLNGVGQQDRGFKVFKFTESNFKIWDGTAPQNAEQLSLMLEEFADNILPGATKLGMLYEILLKAGFQLTAKIEKLDICGQEIYAIDDEKLFICLEYEILEDTIRQILNCQPKPKQFISLDSSFRGNDQLKTNTHLQMRDHDIKFRTV